MSSKENVIEYLVFELTHFEAAVQNFSHYVMKTTPIRKRCPEYNTKLYTVVRSLFW